MIQIGDKLKEKPRGTRTASVCLSIDLQVSGENCTEEMNAILPKDFPSCGVLVMALESAA